MLTFVVLVQFCFLCLTGSLVPADAVLIFELELMDLQKGVPKGFLFIWLEETPDPLFNFMDLNQDGEVPLEEVCFYVIVFFISFY